MCVEELDSDSISTTSRPVDAGMCLVEKDVQFVSWNRSRFDSLPIRFYGTHEAQLNAVWSPCQVICEQCEGALRRKR